MDGQGGQGGLAYPDDLAYLDGQAYPDGQAYLDGQAYPDDSAVCCHLLQAKCSEDCLSRRRGAQDVSPVVRRLHHQCQEDLQVD